VAGALQRCAVVRGAQKHHMPQGCGPALACRGGAVAGGAHHQPAHAVGQYAQLLHRHGPVLQQGFQALCQGLPVGGGVLAGVVAQVHGGVVQRLGQVCAVVVACALPLQVVHAQAVHQQQHLAGGLATGAQCGQVQCVAVLAQFHGQGQGVGIGGQAVAHHAVQCGQQCLAFGRGRRLRTHACALQRGLQPPQCGLHAHVHPMRHPVDALVHQAGDAACAPRRGRAGQAQGVQHRAVHALGNARHARRRLCGQARRAAQVCGAQRLQGRACGLGFFARLGRCGWGHACSGQGARARPGARAVRSVRAGPGSATAPRAGCPV
jgi:hypothetical protein